MLEKILESPLDCKEIQPVHSEGDQPWDFLGRNDAKAETPVLWPPHVKSWFIGKDSDAGRDWGQEEKGMTEDEMAGWHHWLNGHESEQALGDGDRQGSLTCCSPWGRKESDMTERLNWMMVFPVIIYECEIWTIKKAECRRTDAFELLCWRRLESPLAYKIKPVNPKGNQYWIFILMTAAEAESPILWPADVKNWLIEKDPDAGKDWRQEEKRAAEDEMFGWHHWLNGHEFEQTGRWWRTEKPVMLQSMG